MYTETDKMEKEKRRKQIDKDFSQKSHNYEYFETLSLIAFEYRSKSPNKYIPVLFILESARRPNQQCQITM